MQKRGKGRRKDRGGHASDADAVIRIDAAMRERAKEQDRVFEAAIEAWARDGRRPTSEEQDTGPPGH
jgi:hypothetical protein